MLALQTGWTPDILRDLPMQFRAAAHWALYVRAVVGDEGLDTPEVPANAGIEARSAVAKVQLQHTQIRAALFPEDD